MDIPVNYETKTKDSFFDVIKSFFATSIDNEDEVDKRVKEIEQQQDERQHRAFHRQLLSEG